MTNTATPKRRRTPAPAIAQRLSGRLEDRAAAVMADWRAQHPHPERRKTHEHH